MTLPLTPENLHAAYEYLRTTPPFKSWRLPEADDVEFRVASGPDQGWYDYRDGQDIIAVSGARVGHTIRLFVVTSHEMVHLYQRLKGTATSAQHNAEFKRLAKQVCRYHGYDPKEF